MGRESDFETKPGVGKLGLWYIIAAIPSFVFGQSGKYF